MDFHNYPETKIVSIDFVSPDTGEILSHASKVVVVKSDSSLSNFIDNYIKSFLRGVRQQDLAILCSVTKPFYKQLSFFE